MPLPLEQYGMIGDCQTAALVGSDGSIDWLCFPWFDSGACFAALLGNPKNGRWLLRPEGDVKAVSRRYRGDTLILETDYETPEGAVTVVDCMPPRTDTPLPTPTLEPPPTVEFTNYGPVNFPADVNPLTGLKVANPSLLERYPLAVKVQIFPRGQRPAWGISMADIVYDYYQNNGLTRFHAIFLGNDAAQVGPIRSARLLDGHLVNMYKSIFAFGSADRRILNRIFSNQYSNRLVLEGYSK